MCKSRGLLHGPAGQGPRLRPDARRPDLIDFPQSRVSDHRIGLTLYKLEQFINGDMDEVIDALITADTAEKLKASGENEG